MRNKISLVIISNTGSLQKQFCISKSCLALFLLCLLGIFVSIGYLFHDYERLRNRPDPTARLEQKINAQMEEICGQRKQIQSFAEKINHLKQELVALYQFEKKVRSIANVDDKSGQEDLFGVGGPIPEDLETSLEPQKDHVALLRKMHDQTDQLAIAVINRKESFESLIDSLIEQNNLMAATPAIRPVKGLVTSRFGYRSSPFTGDHRELHRGLDIAARRGTPIKATADGKVTYSGWKGPTGKVVIIDHGHGVVTLYGHMSKVLKKAGDRVKRGDVIGKVGSTGRSTGSHLHYEVQLNGVPVNPEKYIFN